MAESSVPEEQKKCRTCKELKPRSAFSKAATALCKPCYNAARKEHYAGRAASLQPLRADSFAECRTCKEVKPDTGFYPDIRKGGRPVRDCKACISSKQKQLRAAASAARPAPPPITEKQCKRCSEVKPISDFQLGGWQIRGGERRRYRGPYCTPCKNEYSRTRPGIKARKAAYQRQYGKTSKGRILKRLNRQKNSDTHNAASRRWKQNNPEKRRLIALACTQKRRTEQGWNVKSPEIKAAIEQTLDLARVGDKYLDAYSGELIEDPTIDHIVPISKGGTNDADNLCVTSLSNNSSKFNDDLVIWLIKRVQTSRNTS